MVMRDRVLTLLVAIVLVLLVVGSYIAFVGFSSSPKSSTSSGSECGISLVQKIILPNASGRIDHMDVDVSTGKMYVAMLANDTLAVLDLNRGSFVESVAGLQEPQYPR